MPEPLTDERLAEIAAREQAATPGEWTAWDSGVGFHIGFGPLYPSGLPAHLLPEGMRTDIGRREDAEFIAHARQDVGDLLAEVERLRADQAVAFSAHLYLEIQRVLDAAHGTEEADGAGEGIVADVALLASQRDAARAELDDLRGRNAMTEANFTDYAEATHEENERLRAELSRVQEEANASIAKLAAENERLQADNQRLRTGIAETIEHIGETAVWTQPLLAMLDAAKGSAE